jgi:hypothetical protein
VRNDKRTLQTLVRFVLFAFLLIGATSNRLVEAIEMVRSQAKAAGPIDGLSERPLRTRRDPLPAEMIRFLEEVERLTPPGSRIAVALPAPWYETHYWYVQHRTHYILAGRLAAIPPKQDSPLFEMCDYIAAWHPAWPLPQGAVVQRMHGGVLLQKERK